MDLKDLQDGNAVKALDAKLKAQEDKIEAEIAAEEAKAKTWWNENRVALATVFSAGLILGAGVVAAAEFLFHR